jgi:cytochrome c5
LLIGPVVVVNAAKQTDRADSINNSSAQESVMKARNLVSALVATGLLCASTVASAYDADWKRGRIYYRSVCTACHAAQAGGSIAPSTMTKAQWAAYLQADKHAKGKDSLKQYLSKGYRASIRSQNKAADKFADLPDEELMEDLKAFVTKGAKDGDAPASCS